MDFITSNNVTITDWLGRWTETVVAYFKVLSQNIRGEAQKEHTQYEPRYSILAQIRTRNLPNTKRDGAATAMFGIGFPSFRLLSGCSGCKTQFRRVENGVRLTLKKFSHMRMTQPL
jgi:hypothetical protein